MLSADGFSPRWKAPAHAHLELEYRSDMSDCCRAIHHMAVHLHTDFSAHHQLSCLRIDEKHLTRT